MFTDPLGLWSFWYGGSAIGQINDTGYNIGAGFYNDSERGDGLYFTAGKAGEDNKFAISAGGEVGLYSGSISGDTTVATAGVGPFSVGVVVGEGKNIFGINIGIVAGISYGAPIEFSVSHNTTWATKGTNCE